jgi:hypothetical protein
MGAIADDHGCARSRTSAAHRDNGIVVGRRVRVDYDDDTCILECRVADGGWPRLGLSLVSNNQ